MRERFPTVFGSPIFAVTARKLLVFLEKRRKSTNGPPPWPPPAIGDSTCPVPAYVVQLQKLATCEVCFALPIPHEKYINEVHYTKAATVSDQEPTI